MVESMSLTIRRGRRRYCVFLTRHDDERRHVAHVTNFDGTWRKVFKFPAGRGKQTGERFSTGLAERAVDAFVAWFAEAARTARQRALARRA